MLGDFELYECSVVVHANNSATSATSSASSLTSFNGIYRGSSSSAPSSPATGQLWYDSLTNQLNVYTGSKFKPVGSTTNSATAPTNAVLFQNFFGKDLAVYKSKPAAAV